MKSTKLVKSLDEIVKPYTFTPKVDIFVGVNGSMRTLRRGIEATITEAEFQILVTSDYAKYL